MSGSQKIQMAITDEELGTTDIKKLLIKQAAPASIGILFMSLNILIDTIFVDNGSVHSLSQS
jgi:Na+-driven multidrug efflux pump